MAVEVAMGECERDVRSFDSIVLGRRTGDYKQHFKERERGRGDNVRPAARAPGTEMVVTWGMEGCGCRGDFNLQARGQELGKPLESR